MKRATGTSALLSLSFTCSAQRKGSLKTRLILQRILGMFPQFTKITQPSTMRETSDCGGKRKKPKNVLEKNPHFGVRTER